MTRLEEIKNRVEKTREDLVGVTVLVLDDLLYLIEELERARKHTRDVHILIHSYFANDEIVAEGAADLTEIDKKILELNKAVNPDECISDLE